MEQLRGFNHQTEHEEHHELAEPSQTVEEGLGLALAGELVVTDDESADIDRQVGVSLQVMRDGEDEDAGGQDHDGVQGFVAEFDAAHELNQSLTECKSEDGTHDELDNNGLDDG